MENGDVIFLRLQKKVNSPKETLEMCQIFMHLDLLCKAPRTNSKWGEIVFVREQWRFWYHFVTFHDKGNDYNSREEEDFQEVNDDDDQGKIEYLQWTFYWKSPREMIYSIRKNIDLIYCGISISPSPRINAIPESEMAPLVQ